MRAEFYGVFSERFGTVTVFSYVIYAHITREDMIRHDMRHYLESHLCANQRTFALCSENSEDTERPVGAFAPRTIHKLLLTMQDTNHAKVPKAVRVIREQDLEAFLGKHI